MMGSVASMTFERIAFIGNYLPRQCGIATFTTDLRSAVSAADPTATCFAIPVNDTPDGYAYPACVRFELREKELASYHRAADYLNINKVDVVCLQHEYGIYGGPAGSHILALLRDLRMPIVATLHTVLREPDAQQHEVMVQLGQLADRLVVMSELARTFLQDIYGIPKAKIDLIPHGIPDVPFVDPTFYKDDFGVAGKTVILTFGLLNPNKGVEYGIEALPAILDEFPDVVFMVVGATHPHLRRSNGEQYRLSLQRLARQLGVHEHVIFHDRFFSLEELVKFIGVADLYLTPYLNDAQIVSGTLAYTFGAGKAIISTPYWYAEELLADGRGVLIPMRDSDAVARAVVALLHEDTRRHAMRKAAYLAGRHMIWPVVAEAYLRSFAHATLDRSRAPRRVCEPWRRDERLAELPILKLDHLRRMTDDTGLLQHAIYSVPNYRHGYCVDDNARALVLTTLLEGIHEDGLEVHLMASRYLAFLLHAFRAETGTFHNFLSYEREWLDAAGSEDCHGRALWALGTAAGRSAQSGIHGLASQLFLQALPAALEHTSPRAWAFTVLGIHEYLRYFSGHSLSEHVRETLVRRLMRLYEEHSAQGWQWVEPILTYANARIPHALIVSGRVLERGDLVEVGLAMLDWLAKLHRGDDGQFVPVGSEGWYPRSGERARFDQQPIEAHAMIAAALEAYRVTGDDVWIAEARRAFDWFLGRNDLGLPLYDVTTGGCRDGLQPAQTNENQGAESTLAFLLSVVELRRAESVIPAA